MEAPVQGIRIVKLWPNSDWEAIWRNLALAPTAQSDIVTWYKVIHDIIPTNDRLHRIKIAPTDICTECGRKDTISHRLKECGEGQNTWERIKAIIARMLRTSPVYIPDEWLMRPSLRIWPPRRLKGILWVLSRYVHFRIHHPPLQNANEMMDFLRRSKWKLYQKPNRRDIVANYLIVLDDEPGVAEGMPRTEGHE